MAESIRDEVIRIIAHQAVLDVADVTTDSTLAELGIDSLGLVEAIFAIEECFEVTVPFNANDPQGGAFDISTVGSVIAAVEGLVAAKAA